jgi:hypothetical protein
MSKIKVEAFRQNGDASRKGNIIYIAPLDPACKVGSVRALAGQIKSKVQMSNPPTPPFAKGGRRGIINCFEL